MRRRRRAKDWVYNAETYSNVVDTVLVGIGNAVCLRLYDSVNHILHARGDIAAPTFQHGQERADTRGSRYYALDGLLQLAPTTWATGTTINLIAALIITEQDPVDGSCLLDANFNLGTGVINFTPGVYANQYTVVRTWRMQRGFGTSNDMTIVQLPLRWFSRMGRYLRNQDGVFLYLEAPVAVAAGAPVNIRFQPWCRSLVSKR